MPKWQLESFIRLTTTLAVKTAKANLRAHTDKAHTVEPDNELPTLLIVFHLDLRAARVKDVVSLCHSRGVCWRRALQLTRNGYTRLRWWTTVRAKHPTESAVRSRDGQPISFKNVREAEVMLMEVNTLVYLQNWWINTKSNIFFTSRLFLFNLHIQYTCEVLCKSLESFNRYVFN